MGGQVFPLRLRSFVGLIPLFAVELLESKVIERTPHFKKRMRWFLENRADLARHVSFMEEPHRPGHTHYLLAIPSRDRLARVLRYALDEGEFLSPYGLRSLSRVHLANPFNFQVEQGSFRVTYLPGESDSGVFGGNSNWRGPIWFPLNYLFIEALERYHHFYQGSFRVECPIGSGHLMTLKEVARELGRRLVQLFLPDSRGMRPCHGKEMRYAQDPNWRELLLFHEYFHADTGEGLGASHQTGWTSLVARCLEDLAHSRQR